MTASAGNNEMTVTTVDLLRHGEAGGGDIFRGSTDSPLTTTGMEQMRRSLQHHQQNPPWQHVVTSPLKRCLQFAQQMDTSFTIEQGFQEIHFGDWEGLAVTEVYARSGAAVDAFWHNPVEAPPPNGEAMPAFRTRIIKAWQQLLQAHCGQHTLLVSHGGVIRVILAELLGMPLRPVSRLAVPHGCLSQIKIFHQQGKADWPQLIYHNDSAGNRNVPQQEGECK